MPPFGYDKIIIGTFVYADIIQPEVKKFCTNNFELFISKPFSLYLSCLSDKKSESLSYIEKSISKDLINNAVIIDSLELFFDFRNLNSFERQIIKIVGKAKK